MLESTLTWDKQGQDHGKLRKTDGGNWDEARLNQGS